MTWNIPPRLSLSAVVASVATLAGGCDTLGFSKPEALEKAGIISDRRVSTNIHKRLVENSIAVTSVSQPGIVFGLNDSGNGPLLFAFDSTGRGRGFWEIERAANRDWEAAALAPCGTGLPTCLFIGDTGDNDARKDHVSVYLVDEPTALDSMPASAVPLRIRARLDVRYSDHPHDVEAMYVTADRAVYLITKRRLLDGSGRPRPALVFRVAPSAWDSSGTVTAQVVDSLPIVPGEAQGRQITDAALSPDGRRLAVRTYAEIFVFAMDSGRGLPQKDVEPITCRIAGLREKQGEGIGWWPDQRHLILTSERKSAPFHIVECRLPD